MDNRIRQIEVRDRSLVPTEAEVWITVTAEQHTPTTELRGRLMGPSCPYAATVEVAYPLRPLPPGRTPPGSTGLTMRVVIPEASLWEPESPFLYHGPIELWQDGRRCDQLTLRHGLRSVQLGPAGLRVNSRPLTFHGRSVTACSDTDARSLRQAGCNLLLAPVAAETMPVWGQADRFGFLVLGRVPDAGESTRIHVQALSRHTSCLGWLIEDESILPSLDLPAGRLVGWMAEAPPGESALAGVDFLVGPAAWANRGKALLVRGAEADRPANAVVLGHVE